MKFTPDHIERLRLNEVFVFESNLAGRHWHGCARQAKREFGAADGHFEGLTGCCYAIPVKDGQMHYLPLDVIEASIARFLAHARERPAWFYSVTKIGCAAHFATYGHRVEDIAPLFFRHGHIPVNISLPKEFWTHRHAKAAVPTILIQPPSAAISV